MNTLPVTLIFSDGAARTIDANPGETVVVAAARAGLSLLVDCAEGRCGTCACSVLAGEIEMGDYDRQTLLDEDRADGQTLACVTKITEAVVFEFPYDFSEATANREPAQVGVVSGMTLIAQETLRLDVDVDSPLAFLSGQYVHLGPVDGSFVRSFSMANETGSRRLTFFVRLVQGGQCSRWLTEEMAVGSPLAISQPRGAFFLREEARPRLFVAGGTGLAPILSMLRQMAGTASAGGQRADILIGARSSDHLFALDQIRELVSQVPNATLSVAVEEERAAHQACGTRHTGRVTDLLPGLALDPATRVYVCGPPGMVDACRQAAVDARIPRQEVLCERFT